MPKCGTQSFRALTAGIHRYQSIGFDGRCVFIVRHPIDRFISLWKSKCRDKQSTAKRYAYIRGLSIDELLDVIEDDEHFDQHWLPQWLVEAGRATELVPFEKFSEWATAEGFGELPHRNKTEGTVELTEEQRRRVLEYYAKDLELYESSLLEYHCI